MSKLLYSSQARPEESLPVTAPLEQIKPSFITGRLVLSLAGAVALVTAVAWAGFGSASLSLQGALALSIFIIAIWAWVFSPLTDTYVSLAAAVALVLTGIISTERFTASLGT